MGRAGPAWTANRAPLNGPGAGTVNIFDGMKTPRGMPDNGSGLGGGLTATGPDPFSLLSALEQAAPAREKLKLEPKLGRTVVLNGQMDVSRAISMLNMSCARNRVKRDEIQQSRHERAGAKRKRLRRERWRRVFRDGFNGTLRRVMELRGMGWQ